MANVFNLRCTKELVSFCPLVESIFDVCEVTLHREAELICANMQERDFLFCRYVDLKNADYVNYGSISQQVDRIGRKMHAMQVTGLDFRNFSFNSDIEK